MKQVAHQAVVMQFILEVASHSQQDPRGCFRQFFHKAKVSQLIGWGGVGGGINAAVKSRGVRKALSLQSEPVI